METIEDRTQVILETYNTAIANGDKNVYFIDGKDMYYSLEPDMSTVDRIHPNDFGFYCMAEKIGEVIEKVIK